MRNLLSLSRVIFFIYCVLVPVRQPLRGPLIPGFEQFGFDVSLCRSLHGSRAEDSVSFLNLWSSSFHAVLKSFGYDSFQYSFWSLVLLSRGGPVTCAVRRSSPAGGRGGPSQLGMSAKPCSSDVSRWFSLWSRAVPSPACAGPDTGHAPSTAISVALELYYCHSAHYLLT